MKRCLWLVAMLWCLIAHAQAASILDEQAGALDMDGLTQAAGEYAPSQNAAEVDFDMGLEEILETGSEQLFGILRKAIRSGTLLLTVVLLCSLVEGACVGTVPSGAVQVSNLTGVMAVTAIAVIDVHSLIGMGNTALSQMASFSQILLPTMAVATAASGSPSGAAARQFATMLFSTALIGLITQLLLPLVYGYIAASVAHASLGNPGLRRIATGLKWTIVSILTAVLIAFVGYLSVSGVIAGSADALAVKTAKFAVSSMVPVVGGILSDASETILAGAGILKNSVGIFGMLAILSICLIPFLQLGVHYLVYKLTATLAATVSDGQVAGCIDGIGGAFGLVLGMTGACALLLMISMVSAVSMVTP